jgi:hypothetical protein
LKFRNGIGEKNAEGSGGAVSKALAWWTLTIQKFALVVVLCAVGLTGLAVDYTARNLEMNTSTSDMIDARTPFRRNNDAFDRAFPQFSDLLVIVLDGPNAEATQIAAAGLTQAMVARTDLFDAVTQPGEDGFFKQNGLLYLSEPNWPNWRIVWRRRRQCSRCWRKNRIWPGCLKFFDWPQ